MTAQLNQHKQALEELCRRYAVQRLELFGSGATDSFDPSRSDLDFLVEFGPDSERDLFHRYFELQASLENLFTRKVDLVMIGAMKNPYFIKAVNETRQLVYAA